MRSETFSVDEGFLSRSHTNYSKASNYRLPEALPHHPLLPRLESIYLYSINRLPEG